MSMPMAPILPAGLQPPPALYAAVSVPAGATVHMAPHWKLVIDARDAPVLANFRAAALGYEVEVSGSG